MSPTKTISSARSYILTCLNLEHPVPLLVPADGDICAYGRRLIVLHPGCKVEEAGQQQVDQGHQDGESQQAGLVQQGILDGTTSTLLKVLLGRENKNWMMCSLTLLLVVLPPSRNHFLSCFYLSQIFVILLLITCCEAACVSFSYYHMSHMNHKCSSPSYRIFRIMTAETERDVASNHAVDQWFV